MAKLKRIARGNGRKGLTLDFYVLSYFGGGGWSVRAQEFGGWGSIIPFQCLWLNVELPSFT